MKTISARKISGKPVTEDVLAEAIARGKQLYQATPTARSVRFLPRDREIEIVFEGRTPVRLHVGKFKELASLSDEQIARLSVGFAGKALCLDEVDLHLSINGLIGTKNTTENKFVVIFRDRSTVRTDRAKRKSTGFLEGYRMVSSGNSPTTRNWTSITPSPEREGARAIKRARSDSVLKGLLNKSLTKKKTRSA